MGYKPVDVYVLNTRPPNEGVESVVVRVYDETGTTFYTQEMTDSEGKASFLLNTQSYQLRFYKFQVSFNQPLMIDVLEDVPNIFEVRAGVFTPPAAVDPRLCRASGFFRRVDGSVAVGHDIHIIAKFNPLLFDGSCVLTERVHTRTDKNGYVELDLIRFAEYDVTIEGFEDCTRTIYIPDAPSVNLPSLVFEVVAEVELDQPGPYNLSVGEELNLYPTVITSTGRVLEGSGKADVFWGTTDVTVAAVSEVTTSSITLRGMSAGSAQLTAARRDASIITIPDPGVRGQPIDITVV